MPDTPATNTESKEVPKCAIWFIISLIILIILLMFGLLVWDTYKFASIIGGDPTFINQLSYYPIDMETAIPAAKLYLGFTVTILSLYLFQLTTCVTSFKFDIHCSFIILFLASVFINMVVSGVYYFMADFPVRATPIVTFWATLGISSGIAKIC